MAQSAAPTVSQMNPTASVAPGTTINVAGTGYDNTTYVSIDNGAWTLTPSVYAMGTTLSFVLPSNIGAGSHTVQIRQQRQRLFRSDRRNDHGSFDANIECADHIEHYSEPKYHEHECYHPPARDCQSYCATASTRSPACRRRRIDSDMVSHFQWKSLNWHEWIRCHRASNRPSKRWRVDYDQWCV